MRAQALWMPGEFPTTNKLLDLQRSSGFYEGVRRVRGGKAPRYTFAQVIAKIREQAGFAAKARKLTKVQQRVPLLFVHLGSGRRDPSSWYLAAKAIEDGLVDAGVLSSDRFDVLCTAGRAVSASDPIWRENVARVVGVDPEGHDGMFVAVGVPDGLAIL